MGWTDITTTDREPLISFKLKFYDFRVNDMETILKIESILKADLGVLPRDENEKI